MTVPARRSTSASSSSTQAVQSWTLSKSKPQPEKDKGKDKVTGISKQQLDQLGSGAEAGSSRQQASNFQARMIVSRDRGNTLLGSHKKDKGKDKAEDDAQSYELSRIDALGNLAIMNEILLHIFSFLDYVSLARMQLVNKTYIYPIAVSAIVDRMPKDQFVSQEEVSLEEKFKRIYPQFVKTATARPVKEKLEKYYQANKNELVKELNNINANFAEISLWKQEILTSNIFCIGMPCFDDLDTTQLQDFYQKCVDKIGYGILAQAVKSLLNRKLLSADNLEGIITLLEDHPITLISELNEMLQDVTSESETDDSSLTPAKCYKENRLTKHLFLGGDTPATASATFLFTLFQRCITSKIQNYCLLYCLGMVLVQRKCEGKINPQLLSEITRYIHENLIEQLITKSNADLIYMAMRFVDPRQFIGTFTHEGLKTFLPSELTLIGWPVSVLKSSVGSAVLLKNGFPWNRQVMLGYKQDKKEISTKATITHATVLSGDPAVVRTVLKNCPVDGLDSNGLTPLHYAILSGLSSQIVEELLDAKADYHLKTPAKMTALELAISTYTKNKDENLKEIIVVLIKHRIKVENKNRDSIIKELKFPKELLKKIRKEVKP